ncbi:hypothetical protein N473_02835 [Pseudoalteromonas luteoviolacea CPMOR-1]|uniref:MHD domain-containing protein n=1 Tax=Pseudoalteromonas luteoviolacea CPMOR-1 TaxID=1365248 RepID=A0A167IS19_9GAMM|nr:DUF1566 domain-containing protein [Pseudoalteromonas luteoviolacea]KZN59869.1 hypothetical protein N473_02835 [Pseudoalteromonas luteoviolacea CPMOR-1]
MVMLRFFLMLTILLPELVLANCQIIESIKGVNIRSLANSSASKIGYMNVGEQYALVAKEGNWASFWYDGEIRWSYANGYLSESTGQCVSPVEESIVRASANEQSTANGTVSAGSQWVVTSDTLSGWKQVWHQGKLAFLSTQTLHSAQTQIISKPNLTAFTGSSYRYSPRLNSSGQAQVSLVEAPQNMTVNSGELVWLPDITDVGQHQISLSAQLETGEVLTQTYMLDVHSSDVASCVISEAVKGVNVRESNSSSSAKVGYINKGEQYPRARTEGNWHHVWFEGQAHWAYAKGYLTTAGGRCLSINNTTNLYAQPDTSSEQLKQANLDSVWVVLQEQPDWYEVQFKGASAYLLKADSRLIPRFNDWQYISIANNKTYPNSTFSYQPMIAPQNPANFTLTSGPEGMELIDGQLKWRSQIQDLGVHSVTITASDIGGSELTQQFTVTVEEAASAQCQIVEVTKGVNVRADKSSSSEKVGYLHLGEQYALIAQDGHWANIWFDGQARWAYASGYLQKSAGTCATTQALADIKSIDSDELMGIAELGSQWVIQQQSAEQVTIFFAGELARLNKVDTEASQTSLAFVSEPITQATIGQLYQYPLRVNTDAETTYQLISAPTGMVIENDTIEWALSPESVGTHLITVTATTQQQQTTQSFSLNIEPDASACQFVESIKGVNVRSENSSSSQKVGYISQGQRYRAQQKVGNWYQIWFDGQLRWSYGNGYLIPVTEACNTISLSAQTQVYDFANEQAPIIGAVNSDSQWSIISENEFWANIWFAGQSSYVKKQTSPLNSFAPEIISNPVLSIQAKQVYSYQIELKRAASSTSYQLIAAPQGMSVNRDGLIQWYPAVPLSSPISVTVEVEQNGNTVEQSFELSVSAAPAVEGCPMAETARSVYVRSSPSRWGRVVGTLGSAEQVLLGDEQSGYIDIAHPTIYGWVASRDLTKYGQAACLTVIKSGGRGYPSPDSTDPNLWSLYTESRYFIHGQTEGWYKVYYVDEWGNGFYTWIEEEYVEAQGTQLPMQFSGTSDTYNAYVNELFYLPLEVKNQSLEAKFTLVNAPQGMTIDAVTGLVSWLPTNSDNHLHQVDVRVSDGVHFDDVSFSINLSNAAARCEIILTSPDTAVYASSTSMSAMQRIAGNQSYAVKSSSQARFEIYFDEQPRWVEKSDVHLSTSAHCSEISNSQAEVREFNGTFAVDRLGFAGRGTRWPIVDLYDDSHYIFWFDGKLGRMEKSYGSTIPPKAIIATLPSIVAGQPFNLTGFDSLNPSSYQPLQYMWRINGEVVSSQAQVGISGLSAGDYHIALSVIDSHGQTHTAFTQLKVFPAGTTLTEFTSIPKVAVLRGQSYSYELTTNTAEPLSYALLQAPPGMTISDAGVVQWEAVTTGINHVVEVVATTRSGEVVVQKYLLSVQDTNIAPEFTSTAPIKAVVGYEYQYHVKAFDKDGAFRVGMSDAPDGMTLDHFKVIRWTPTSAQLGEHHVELTAFDGIVSTEQAFTIRVEQGADQDLDGVPDIVDLCSNTIENAQVDTYGCTADDKDRHDIYSESQVPKTGQKNSLMPFDDGFYQHGKSAQFNVLNDGLVENQNTLQIWADLPESSAQALTWQQAHDYCDTLSHGGISNWRLPNAEELFFLVQKGAQQDSLLPAEFTVRRTGRMWTREKFFLTTTSGVDLTSATQIDVSTGHSYGRNSLEYDEAGAMCVSGEIAYKANLNSYTYGVYDVQNQLVWQPHDMAHEDIIGRAFGFHEAVQYCEALEHAGFSDWRLPNINELYSLGIDEQAYQNYFRRERYGQWRYYSFWSATKGQGDDQVLMLRKDGHEAIHTSSLSAHTRKEQVFEQHGLVRCVRDWAPPQIHYDYQSTIQFGELIEIDFSGTSFFGEIPDISWQLACKGDPQQCQVANTHNDQAPDVGEWEINVQLRKFGFEHSARLPLTVLRSSDNNIPTVQDLEIVRRLDGYTGTSGSGYPVHLEIFDADVSGDGCNLLSTHCGLQQRLRIEVVEMPQIIRLGEWLEQDNVFVPYQAGDFLPQAFNFKVTPTSDEVIDQMKIRVFDGQDYSRVATIKFKLSRYSLNQLANLGADIGLLPGSDYILEPKLAAQGVEYERDLSYLWELENSNVSFTSPSIEIKNAQNDAVWKLTITDPQGQSASNSVHLVVAKPLPEQILLKPGESGVVRVHTALSGFEEPLFTQLTWHLNGEPWGDQDRYTSWKRINFNPGEYQITAKLEDVLGQTAEYTSAVKVADWPADFVLENITFVAGQNNVMPHFEEFEHLGQLWVIDGRYLSIEDGRTPFRYPEGQYEATLSMRLFGNSEYKTYSTQVTVLPSEMVLPQPEKIALISGSDHTLQLSGQALSTEHYSYSVRRESDGELWLSPTVTLNNVTTLETYHFTVRRFDGEEATTSITVIPSKPLPAHINLHENERLQLLAHDLADNAVFKDYQWHIDGELVSNNARLDTVLGYGTYALSLSLTDSFNRVKVYRSQISVKGKLAVCRPVQQFTEEQLNALNPDENIPWTGADYVSVEEIAKGFNHARSIDQTTDAKLAMPSQANWDAMSVAQQALYLINAERIARGLVPYSGVSKLANEVADNFAQHLIHYNAYGHFRVTDGADPTARLTEHLPDLTQFSSSYGASEVLMASGAEQHESSKSSAMVHAIYVWFYFDKVTYSGIPWGHRHGLFSSSPFDAQSHSASAGLLGVGSAQGMHQLDSNPERDTIMSLVNPIHFDGDWPQRDTLSYVDHSRATLCSNPQLQLPADDDMVAINLYPEILHLTPGSSEEITVQALYSDGSSQNLSTQVQLQNTSQNVFSFSGTTVTGGQPGEANLVVHAGGIVSNTVKVSVADRVILNDAELDEFVKKHSQYIADNATVTQFPTSMFALYTGRVLDQHGGPLADAKVSFNGKPELGDIKTDQNGAYTIAGWAGSVTIDIAKPGYLRVQRSLVGDNQAWNSVEQVKLQKLDSKVSTISLLGSGNKTHRSALISDVSGERSTTLVFDQVTKAIVTSRNGEVRELDTLSVRATEFETPQSMPGILPAETAFTYCSELDIGGVADHETVEFDQPVTMYVDNFLDFAVGELVPIGYYDRHDAKWKASENGVVVKLLDANNDGLVDGADYTGDDIADDIDGDGATEDEVTGIEHYQAGKTYWRGEMRHFTPYDFNWSANADGQPPADVEVVSGDSLVVDENNDECAAVSSYIKPKTQELHEDISILGSGITLHYNSARTADYHHVVRANISEETVPANATVMHAVFEVAGHRFEQQLTPLDWQNVEFVWDGKDVNGQSVEGEIRGTLSIGYEFQTQYLSAGNIAESGLRPAQTSPTWAVWGTDPLGVEGRQTEIRWSNSTVTLYSAPKSHIANGWSLSNHHTSDRAGNIYKGDGEVETSKTKTNVVSTGIQFSVVDGDDGYYRARGKKLNYRVSNYDYIIDLQTKLDWQRTPTETLMSKSEAQAYCAALDYGDGERIRWRLPSIREILYTIDKSGKERDTYIYTINASTGIWSESYEDLGQKKPALCVRGWAVKYSTADFPLVRDDNRRVLKEHYSGNQLMWQDTTDNVSLLFNWKDAINYCENLDHAGYTDWRMPNVNEYLYVVRSPAFEHRTLAQAPDGASDSEKLWTPYVEWRQPYWTATPNVGAPQQEAWAIDLAGTGYHAYSQEQEQYNVRCVRDDIDHNANPYGFGRQGQHVQTIDPATGVKLVKFDYDESSGLLTSVTDRFGNRIELHRDEQDKVTRIVSPSGLETYLQIDDDNNLRSVSYADNTGHKFNYLGQLLHHQTDPNGNVFERFFDARGRIERSVDPEGGQWQFYSQFDPQSNSTVYGYTTAQNNRFEVEESFVSGYRQAKTTYLDGSVEWSKQTSSNVYEQQIGDMLYRVQTEPLLNQLGAAPNLVVTKTPSGIESKTQFRKSKVDDNTILTVTQNGVQKTDTIYNSYHNTVTTRSGMGRESTLVFNPRKLLTERSEVEGFAPVHYAYDSHGRITRVSQGTRNTMYYYDDSYGLRPGLLEKVVTNGTQQVSYQYDEVGQVLSSVISSGGVQTQATEFEYDNNGNVIALTPDGRTKHHFSYDANNYPTSYQAPDTAQLVDTTTSYVYDTDRRIKSVTLPSGDQIKAIYANGLDRIDAVETPYGRYAIDYNEVGNVTQYTAPNGDSLSYHFDGLLFTGVDWRGEVVGDYRLHYTQKGELEQFCVNQSHCADYGYDLDGLVTRIGNLSLVRAADRMGIITGTSIENITHEISYNQYGELTGDDFEFNQQALYRSEYAHDDNGRIVRKTEYLTGNTELQDYVYDDLGRLSEVDDGEKVTKYQYDSNGNRLIEEITQGTSTVRVAATYDEQDRLLTYGNCTFSYTTNGHLASKVCAQQEQRFSYDIFGNLLGVEVYNDGAISKQIAYHVDPQNRRVAKWVDGQKTTSYLYAGQLNPVAELDSEGKLSALFIYGSKGHVPDYMVKGGRQYRFITDQLGSPRLIVDAASGEIAQQLSYGTFGQVTQDTNPGFQPFGFAGGLYDADTQLVRFGARDYDAYTARWTAKDPIGFGGGDTNLYAYVASDPVNFIDPTGHFLANLINAAKEAGTEMLWQLVVEGKSFGCIDYKAVAVAGAGGLVFGGAAAAKAYKMWKKSKGTKGLKSFADGMSQEDAARYNARYNKRAPVESTPYNTHTRYHDNGDIKQVTTYDQYGDRHRQYDLKDSRGREAHQHNFDYSIYPRPKGQRSKEHAKINE